MAVLGKVRCLACLGVEACFFCQVEADHHLHLGSDAKLPGYLSHIDDTKRPQDGDA